MAKPPPKPKVLPPVHPNAGVGAVYRSRLWRAVDAMNASLSYWLKARWEEDPRGANRIIATMRELGKRWQSNFDEIAPDVAGQWGARAEAHTTQRMTQLLDQAGWTVEFRVSPQVQAVMNAAITENVGLIRSIASQHLTRVEGVVMRAVQTGNDIHGLTKELHETFDIPKKRATLIARDQTFKLNAVITKARQTQAGIKRAIWLHSNITTPGHFRPEHLAFSRGQHVPGAHGPIYVVEQGAFLEGQWVWPGTAVNCRCSSRPLLEGFE
jgi:uncharacterized protein with gpF-like domain